MREGRPRAGEPPARAPFRSVGTHAVRIALCVATVGLVAAAPACESGPPPPSLVLVTLDTVRCDHIGTYGGPPDLTPHLDALAGGGRVVDAAYTTMPTTGPAHVSLLTGLHPSEHGARENGTPMDAGHAGRELARRLGARGYATAAFVTTRLLHPDATGLHGFGIHDTPRGALRPGTEAVRAALHWLAAEPRRPVFLWLHLYDAHAPYGTADEKRRSFPVDPALYGWVDPDRYADPAARRAMADRYATGVREADAALGTLLEALPAHFASPPLVVVTGDHGEALDEHLDERGYAFDHGEFLDEDVVCVPLVLRGPGVAPGRVPGPASLRDLYGTLLAAAGAPDPEAAAEGRVDLRSAPGDSRIVVVERRRLAPGSRPELRAQAAAAFDGRASVVVGLDDTGPPEGAAPGERALWEAARAHASRDGGAPPAALDAPTREALESLGYVE